MPRISRPDTHTGDDGTTGTASGKRVSKSSRLIHTFGAIDELNSVIGVILSQTDLSPAIIAPLRAIQNDLFHLGAELNYVESEKKSSSLPCIEERHINDLEEFISDYYDKLGPLQNFTLPGGTPSAASLHFARTVCRRAEREMVTLSSTANISPIALQYINRLSDALFMMARWENVRAGVNEPVWDSHR